MFISFEGIDGCGKSTQMALLKTWFEHKGFSVVCVRFPNDKNPMGARIRQILQGALPKMNPDDLQHLFVLDKTEGLVLDILPALDSGAIVLADRFALSAMAYGMLGGQPFTYYRDLHNKIAGPFMRWPSVNLFLDVPVTLALGRLSARQQFAELFEKKEVLEKVRQNYLYLANDDWADIIDGTRTVDEVFVSVKSVIIEKFFTPDC